MLDRRICGYVVALLLVLCVVLYFVPIRDRLNGVVRLGRAEYEAGLSRIGRVDTILRVDTIWRRDTVLVERVRVVEAPLSGGFTRREEYWGDSVVRINIVDTLRGREVVGRGVSYVLRAPMVVLRNMTVSRVEGVPVITNHGADSRWRFGGYVGGFVGAESAFGVVGGVYWGPLVVGGYYAPLGGRAGWPGTGGVSLAYLF